ncbi:hypothetical protein ACLSY3_07175 [Avibacterium avium]|uniref:hypothetical protein n=1 Tax=Avibacterium avium TaxID=751 RepID=UPI003BF8788B
MSKKIINENPAYQKYAQANQGLFLNREKGIFKDEEEERDYLAERHRVMQELRQQHYQYSVQQIKKEMHQKIERETSRIGLTEQQRDALKVIQEEFKLHMDIELRGVENLLHFDKPESVQKFYQENGFETAVTETGQTYVKINNSEGYEHFSRYSLEATKAVFNSGLGDLEKKNFAEQQGKNDGATAGMGSINEAENSANKNLELNQQATDTVNAAAEAITASNKATGNNINVTLNKVSLLDNLRKEIPDFYTNPKYAEIRKSNLFIKAFAQELMTAEYQKGKNSIDDAISFAKIQVVKDIARTEISEKFVKNMEEVKNMVGSEKLKTTLIENAEREYAKEIIKYCEKHGIEIDEGVIASLKNSQTVNENVARMIEEQKSKRDNNNIQHTEQVDKKDESDNNKENEAKSTLTMKM